MDVTGRVVLAVIIVMLVLAMGSVILRFMERHWSKLPLAWSDWLILLALTYMVVYAGALIHCEFSTTWDNYGDFNLIQKILSNLKMDPLIFTKLLRPKSTMKYRFFYRYACSKLSRNV